jgi:hypothetical protein
MLLSAVGAGCAAAPVGPPPPPPELSFRDVRSVALLRRLDPDAGPGEGRRRDPLDALQGALAARGLKAVTLELPPRAPPGLAAVEQAMILAEGVAEAASPDAGELQVGSIGARAAPALSQLGAEAFAIYVQGTAWADSPRYFGQPYGLAQPPARGSAIAAVARDGTVVTFAWGGRAPYGAGPVNAAEAVDAVLNLLIPPPPE